MPRRCAHHPKPAPGLSTANCRNLKQSALSRAQAEVVTARLRGTLLKGDDDITVATLSAAGSPSNLYVGLAEGDDRFRFFTSNISKMVSQKYGIAVMDHYQFPGDGVSVSIVELQPKVETCIYQQLHALCGHHERESEFACQALAGSPAIGQDSFQIATCHIGALQD